MLFASKTEEFFVSHFKDAFISITFFFILTPVFISLCLLLMVFSYIEQLPNFEATNTMHKKDVNTISRDQMRI